MALLGAVKRIQPVVEFAAAFLRGEAGIIGDVIATAHESVDRAQGLAFAVRENMEGVVEIFGAGASDPTADGVGHGELSGSRRPGGDESGLGSSAHGWFGGVRSGLRSGPVEREILRFDGRTSTRSEERRVGKECRSR